MPYIKKRVRQLGGRGGQKSMSGWLDDLFGAPGTATNAQIDASAAASAAATGSGTPAVPAAGPCPANTQRNQFGYCIPVAPAGPSVWDGISKAIAALAAGTAKPPVAPVYAPPSSGISTTTLAIGGIAAVGLIALLASRR